MLEIRFATVAFVALAASAIPTVAHAQAYPARPIQMLSPPSGGMADIAGRLIAQGISAGLGQNVIVDNRPGLISVEAAAKAAPNGYTLLMTPQSMWVQPLLGTTVSYDPQNSFAPITLAVGQYSILVTHPSIQAGSVKELIALAKAQPDQLNYASGPDGGGPHVGAELFKSMAGVRITRIPYKSSAQALTDVISGRVQLMFAPASAMTQIQAGKVKGLAVTSQRPSALAPGLSPLAATLPGFESGGVAGVLAPAGTPSAIVTRLNQDIVRFLNTTDTRDKLLNAGIEVVGSSPQQFAESIASEMVRMKQLIKDAGIKIE